MPTPLEREGQVAVSTRFILNTEHPEFLPEEPDICSAKPFIMLHDIVGQGSESGEMREMDLPLAATCIFGPDLRAIASRLDGVLSVALDGYAHLVWDSAWLAVSNSDGDRR